MPPLLRIGILVLVGLGLLLSYQMPIYIARLFDIEAWLMRLVLRMINDGKPTTILFFSVWMVIGFVAWAVPVGFAIVFLHPQHGEDYRRAVGRPFKFVPMMLLPVQIAVTRRYDILTGEIQLRRELAKEYQARHRDQFRSFAEFCRFFKWLNENDYVDPREPIGKLLGAASDKIKDAESMLGLKVGYSYQNLKERFATLIKQVHPDIAGPSDLVQRLTDARNLIKSRKGWK